jgi:hypothetical protein
LALLGRGHDGPAHGGREAAPIIASQARRHALSTGVIKLVSARILPDTRSGMRSLRLWGLDRALVCTIGLHVLVRALYADFVPLYDSRQYFDLCAVPYLQQPLELLKLNCFGHPSLAFMALIAAGQAIDLGSTWLLHGVTTALGVASILAFHALAQRLFVGPELLWERRLLVGCYGLGAHCLSVGLNFNPDYGVLVFFLLALERLLAGRLLACAAWGACMMLSKESGLLLYGVIVGAFVLHAWIRPGELPARIALAKSAGVLAAPVALLVGVKLAEHSEGMPTMWSASHSLPAVLQMFTSFELLDPLFLVYAFDVFGLGYGWLLGMPLITAAVALALRALVARPRPPSAGLHVRNLRIVLTVLGLAFLLLTRYRTFNNIRYLAPLFPLVVLGAGWALCALDLRAVVRRLWLAAALALTFSFNFHSHDPISKALFGTFQFGQHPMLRMGAPDPCCGFGRDQLAYNFQLAQLHYLQNEVYRALRPTPQTLLVAADLVDFHFAGRIDATTFERTLRFENAYELRIVDASALVGMKPLPSLIHFIVFPNFDNTRAYRLLAARYREVSQRSFERGGYALRVHTLARNP